VIGGCRHFTTGSRPLRGNMSAGSDGLLVSDDDLEDRDDPRFWFQVDADKDPPSSFPVAGRGLVTGIDKSGETCAALSAWRSCGLASPSLSASSVSSRFRRAVAKWISAAWGYLKRAAGKRLFDSAQVYRSQLSPSASSPIG
jgi:hypothetical protein